MEADCNAIRYTGQDNDTEDEGEQDETGSGQATETGLGLDHGRQNERRLEQVTVGLFHARRQDEVR